MSFEDWINRFKSIHKIVCNTAVGESRSIYLETVDDWKNDRLLHDITGCDLCDIFNVYETDLSFNIQLSKSLTSCGGSIHGERKSKQRVALLLTCNADDNGESLVTDKYRSPHCLNNVKKLTIKYVASRSSWITTMILGEYFMQLDRKMDAKNKKPNFLDHCDATFLWIVKVLFFPPNYQPAASFKFGTYQGIQVQLHTESSLFEKL